MQKTIKKQWMILGLSLLICLLFSFYLAPFSASAEIPKPPSDFYVADYADVLTEETEQNIVSQNDRLYSETGGQIVVVTVDFLDGETIDDYAYDLFNQWEIGSAEYNNGVLLLLAIGEDNYYALTGSGIENELSAGKLDDILYEFLEPDFAAKDYDAGVRKTFDELYSVVSQTGGTVTGNTLPSPDQSPDRQTETVSSGSFSSAMGFFCPLAVVIIIVIISALISSSRRKRRYYHPPTYYPRQNWRRPPMPPPGGFGGFGGNSPFGSSRRSGGGGFSRSSGRSSFGGSSRRSSSHRSGGGGSSRGGGAGRRR